MGMYQLTLWPHFPASWLDVWLCPPLLSEPFKYSSKYSQEKKFITVVCSKCEDLSPIIYTIIDQTYHRPGTVYCIKLLKLFRELYSDVTVIMDTNLKLSEISIL